MRRTLLVGSRKLRTVVVVAVGVGALVIPAAALADPPATPPRADVYVELARPLRLLESGRVADATWDWAFGIRGHCGDHLVDALRAIHRALNSHMSSDYVAEGDAAR